MIDIILIASIIQGEAGAMGPAGMMGVALSLSCRIHYHDHDMDRIDREYYGKMEPGPVAMQLAELVAENKLPTSKAYFYCMGGEADVRRFGWVDGDVIIKTGPHSIHLYENWPQTKEEVNELE